MTKQNEGMLKAHSEMYKLSDKKEELFVPIKPFHNGEPEFNHRFENSPTFKLSDFYTVALSYEGELIEIKNEASTVYKDSELKALAEKIVKSGKTKGTEKNLSFYKMDKDGYILVTFMDNTIVNESAVTLFRYTLIFGVVALVVFFFLSRFLARKIVEPLEDGYKKQKQFISDAGHELKPPVSVVSANAELLERELGDNQWLKNIQYENERMGILVGQLLDLARAENVKPQFEEINFSRLVAGEALPFESVAFEKGINLNTNITDDIKVMGNSTQLKQVVSVLLDNAIKHSVGNSDVTLNLIKENNYVNLSVVNKGEEIPKEHREKLFERFYRVDDARNSESNHYGLGLAIAKAIVDSHKGKIEVLCYNGLVEFKVKIPVL
jgi:signal transduction histidine kinase